MVWRGLIETVAVVCGFVGFGLAFSAAADRAGPAFPAYPPEAMETDEARTDVWLLDGFNVLHAGLLGGRDRSEWWTEARRSEILAVADRFDDAEAEIWVVFDGPRDPDEAGPDGQRLRSVFAPSADEWLLARVRAAEDPSCVAVVTADRKVADRARHRGARVVTPRAFLDRCTG